MEKSNFFLADNIELEVIEPDKITRKVIAHNGKIMMVEVFFKNGAIGHDHTHIHEQAVYCLDGVVEFKIGDEVKVIKKGDSVYIPSMVNHGCTIISEEARLLDVFTPMREDFLK